MKSTLLRSVVLACLLLGSHEASAKPRTYDQLIAVIDGPNRKYDLSDRYQAFEELARFNDMRTLRELIGRLDGKHGALAGWALIDMRVPGSEAVLSKALATDDSWNRSLLCVALGRLGGDKAVAALARQIKVDNEKSVRKRAIYSLRIDAQKRPTGAGVKALMHALNSPELVQSAIPVLWTLHHASSGVLIRKGLSNSSEIVREFSSDWIRSRRDAASTDALFAMLANEKEDKVRGKAMLALAIVHPESRATEVAKLLTNGLKAANPSKALQALVRTLKHKQGAFGPKVSGSIAQHLHRLFRHSDEEIARSALIAARHLGAASTAAKALPLLRSTNPHMRRAALAAVGNSMTKTGEAKALLDTLEDPDGQMSLLQIYVRELRKRKGLAKLVLPALRSPSEHVRRATAKLLFRLEDPIAATPLLKALKKETARTTAEAMARALKSTATSNSLKTMAPLLVKKRGNRESGNAHVAEAFILVDRLQGFKASKPILLRGGTAAQALLKATPGFVGDDVLFQLAAGSHDKMLRGAAAGKLRGSQRLSSLGILCGLIGDKDWYTEKQAIKSLGESHRAGAARCLVAALDSNAGINKKEELFRALRRLSGQRLANDVAAWKTWQKKKMGLGRGVPGLAVALQSGQRERVMMAAYAAQRLSSKDARRLVPAFVDALKNEHQLRARIVLIDALAVAKSHASTLILHKDLDRLRDVGELAARAKALLQIGDKSAYQVMLTKAEDPDFRDRVKLQAALSEIRP